MTLTVSTNPKLVANVDTINAPQAYVIPPVASAPMNRDTYSFTPKTQNSALRNLFKIGVTCAIIAGALAGARASMLKNIDLAKSSDLKGFDKVKYYIAKSGQAVLDAANSVKNCFKKQPKKSNKPS